MLRIGIRELRDNLTSTIRRVRAGEAFEITHDGEPVAVLGPVQRSRLDELVATGQATPARGPLKLPRKRYPAIGGRTSAEILDELRSDRF
ncbi:MAG: type II toxin-antitoxin system Phd/YefM family antitoxin [Gaiellaceae bacterium]